MINLLKLLLDKIKGNPTKTTVSTKKMGTIKNGLPLFEIIEVTGTGLVLANNYEVVPKYPSSLSAS